jgi:hypothetical protein
MSAETPSQNPQPHPNPQPQPSVRGRPFEKGNGGRKPGSKNKTTLVAEALLQGEAVELVRKAIEVAKAGNVQMLMFLLGRILPRERSVRVDLAEMERADDAIDALGATVNAAGTGEITPAEGATLATLVGSYARAINVYELESRLDKIERELAAVIERQLPARKKI